MTISEPAVKALGQIITGDGQYRPFYRTGPDLIQFFNRFGDEVENYGQWFPSRWSYTEAKIRHANGKAVLAEIVKAALDPRDYFGSEVKVEDVVQHLNKFLAFDGYQVIQDGLGYSVQPLAGTKNNNVKNLIFAANGPKPEIVLEDATTNDIRIVKNAEYCLVYNRPLSTSGLMWGELVDWWMEMNGLEHLSRLEQGRNLYTRLYDSLDSPPEKMFLKAYFVDFLKVYGDELPALISQVYLHYDPYTFSQLQGEKRLPRQRMDFLILLPNGKKVVIEIDGKQHYSSGDKASPSLYAEMVSEDRRLKLAGYEVYRFGGHEFQNKVKFEEEFLKFFTKLFETSGLIVSKRVESD